LRTEEEILAEIVQAQREYNRAESAFTHAIGGHMDPIQDVGFNPTPEMIEARERLEITRLHLEELRDEYELYLIYQPGSQEQ
jgi:hypothetical protein